MAKFKNSAPISKSISNLMNPKSLGFIAVLAMATIITLNLQTSNVSNDIRNRAADTNLTSVSLVNPNLSAANSIPFIAPPNGSVKVTLSTGSTSPSAFFNIGIKGNLKGLIPNHRYQIFMINGPTLSTSTNNLAVILTPTADSFGNVAINSNNGSVASISHLIDYNYKTLSLVDVDPANNPAVISTSGNVVSLIANFLAIISK